MRAAGSAGAAALGALPLPAAGVTTGNAAVGCGLPCEHPSSIPMHAAHAAPGQILESNMVHSSQVFAAFAPNALAAISCREITTGTRRTPAVSRAKHAEFTE